MKISDMGRILALQATVCGWWRWCITWC